MMMFGAWIVAIFVAVMPFLGSSASAATSCEAPSRQVKLTWDMAVRKVARQNKAYVEGLVYANGSLYESDGLPGKSMVQQIDPDTGISKVFRRLDNKFYGEGLAQVNSQLVQLTYKQNVAFIYGQTDQKISHPGEAWGLTQLGGELIESDGSSTLQVLDPTTLQVRRHIKVRLGSRPLDQLNELEAAHDRILANLYRQDPALQRIYGKDTVVMINPGTGCVEATIDLSDLRRPEMNDPTDAVCAWPVCTDEDFVANGIAFDDAKDELYFTGKNWPYIFVFQFPK